MGKFEKKIIKLDAEQIRGINKRLRQEQLALDSLNIAIETLKKELELNLLVRNARAQLENYEEQKIRVEGNVHALRKQVRTKQIINSIPTKEKGMTG